MTIITIDHFLGLFGLAHSPRFWPFFVDRWSKSPALAQLVVEQMAIQMPCHQQKGQMSQRLQKQSWPFNMFTSLEKFFGGGGLFWAFSKVLGWNLHDNEDSGPSLAYSSPFSKMLLASVKSFISIHQIGQFFLLLRVARWPASSLRTFIGVFLQRADVTLSLSTITRHGTKKGNESSRNRRSQDSNFGDYLIHSGLLISQPLESFGKSKEMNVTLLADFHFLQEIIIIERAPGGAPRRT